MNDKQGGEPYMSQSKNPLDDPNYRDWIDSLNEISMYDVIDAFDIDRRGDSILCPNPAHHDMRFGNCKIYNNRFHCFACGCSGNNVKLIMNLKDEKFMKAAETLAKQMGYPIMKPNMKMSTQEIQERMPITKTQLEILGLQPNPTRVLIPEAYDIYKPETGEYQGDVFGYMIGPTETFSLDQLYREDKEAFYSIIAGKFYTASKTYIALYESEIWKWGCFSKDSERDIQISLEKALNELNEVAQKLTEARIMDLSYFKMPEIKKKKAKYSITI